MEFAYPGSGARRSDLALCGFKQVVSNVDSNKSCGYECPMIWRRSEGLRGFGQLHWGGWFDDNYVENTSFVRSDGDDNIAWRIGMYSLVFA